MNKTLFFPSSEKEQASALNWINSIMFVWIIYKTEHLKL